MERTPEDPVRDFADAITGSDLNAALAVCHPEIEFTSMLGVSGRAYHGHDGIREYFDDIASAWDEWAVERHRLSAGPDGRVAILMTMHVRGKESGLVLTDRAGHVWTLKDGLLWRNALYRDPDEALLAVGLEP
jgi:ketosteroid isomerase-like protein